MDLKEKTNDTSSNVNDPSKEVMSRLTATRATSNSETHKKKGTRKELLIIPPLTLILA